MKTRNVLESFKYAFKGVYYAARTERNIKIHLIAALLVIIYGFYKSLTTEEWIFISFAIALVIITEMINMALEKTVDLYAGGRYYELAKIAKDVAAGATVIAAINAVIVGWLVFF